MKTSEKPEILYTRKDLDKMISHCANELNAIFKSKNSQPILIGVLNGAAPFMMDLIKKCKFNHKIDFIQVSSYDGNTSSGVVHLKKDISEDIKDKDVVIVEDIIDTGVTLNFLKKYILHNYKPKSVRVVCLIDKKPLRKVDFTPDIVGTTMEEAKFIVGYGFDYDGFARNINYIFIPTKAQIDKRNRLNGKK